MHYKIHPQAYSRNREKAYMGLTMPEEVSQRFSGCYFKISITVIEGKVGIFCESGCPIVPTKKEVESYEYGENP